MASDRNDPVRSVLAVAIFLDELLLLAVLAATGVGLGGTVVLQVTLAVLLPLAAAVGWGLWLAPRASRRLPARRFW